MHGTTPAGTARVTASVAAALSLAVLPVFLIGASTDAIRADLGLSETAIGAAVTVLFTTVGIAASTVGRWTERLGANLALRAGVIVAAVATATIGWSASSWWQLAAPLVFVGVAVGLIDTGGARTFADRLRADRQGFAFGIKEASVPTASLLAGLALPTLTAWFDWRAAFLAAPILAIVVLVLLPRGGGGSLRVSGPATRRDSEPTPTTPATATPTTADPTARKALVRFAVAVGLGAGAATAAPTFLVPASTARGLSTGAAGLLLVAASLASIGARIGLGRWADGERARPTPAVAALLAIGGLGAVLLATPVPAVLAAIGAIVLLGAGWGWTGLAFLAAVRARPEAPAVAAGTVLTGLGIGGALGPLVFGALAENASYAVAWVATAAAMLFASLLAASTVPSVSHAPATPRSES
ncbi:MAG: MFS transporter [Nitriliruptor sp.]|uniref:MFS transporter n=1 Tax=Nitriliruptor sp. TaxID=2448056 RepID=UPI00349FEDD8